MQQSLNTPQVATLQKQYGFNEITIHRQRTLFHIVLEQFRSIFILILFLAAIFSFSVHDIIDGCFILVVIFLNGALGFFQEYKAEKAIEKLRKQSIFVTRVIRDGREQMIDNRLLVPGDTILLEAGNKVPADALLFESINTEVDESLLTGESMPVYKHTGDADAKRLFMGTIVVKGRCKAVVTDIGMQTRFGHLAYTLASVQESPTRLAGYITLLGKQLSVAGVISGLIVFFFSLYHQAPFFETMLISISLIVAVVPEGLPTIITIALTTGAARMAKKLVIIRKMSAIETLGEVSVIATDKTGTITQNKMAVKYIWLDNKTFSVTESLPNITHQTFQKYLIISVLCNNAKLFSQANKFPDIIGDQTEGALLLLATKQDTTQESLQKNWHFIDEFSFDETTKTMTVFYEENNKHFALTKGAPENILAISSQIMQDGEAHALSDKEKKHLQEIYQTYASEGLRVIAFGYKEITEKKKKYTREDGESQITFVGFVGIADPIRPEVKDAIEQTRQAGIRTIMITGDNELTAKTIALEINLMKKDEVVFTGNQLDDLSDTQLAEVLPTISVFARCTPEHKLRIVQAYQKQNAVVAVTGDGINDAPCLKQANVGIAMGMIGTDVTREAADVVITDDNFATIVSGIEEGRIIFDNILKSISYLIAGNFSEILTILIALLVGLPSPFLPVHILWINVVTDSLPAIALALDTKHSRVMKRLPANTALPFISSRRFTKLFLLSFVIALTTLIIYGILVTKTNILFARSMAFTIIILLQMGLAFFMKERQSWYKNPLLFLAIGVALLSQLIILFTPFFQAIFQVGLHP